MTKEQKQIKELTAQVTDLTNQLNNANDKYKHADERNSKLQHELDDLHKTFDLLGVPRSVNRSYYDLSANARLTLLIASMNNMKVEQPKEGD